METRFKRKKSKCNIVVISLFHGLGASRLALEDVEHLNVLRCYSSEIDEYAIKTADKNFPQDIDHKLGNIISIDWKKIKKEIFDAFGDVKILLIGGSPCQGFSIAGRMEGSLTVCGIDVMSSEQYMSMKQSNFVFKGQSYLIWEFIRALKEVSPAYFLLENVRVTNKWLPMFNVALGREPLNINSALLGPQYRDRYYWHNLGNINLPIDKRGDMVLGDILESNNEDTEKCILSEKAISFMKAKVRDKNRIKKGLRLKTRWEHCNINVPQKKAYTLTASMYKGVPHNVTLVNWIWRTLTVRECARLQSIRDSFVFPCSKSQSLKMIGNSFTVAPITYILSHIKEST